jgi:hypothetical protein
MPKMTIGLANQILRRNAQIAVAQMDLVSAPVVIRLVAPVRKSKIVQTNLPDAQTLSVVVM